MTDEEDRTDTRFLYFWNSKSRYFDSGYDMDKMATIAVHTSGSMYVSAAGLPIAFHVCVLWEAMLLESNNKLFISVEYPSFTGETSTVAWSKLPWSLVYMVPLVAAEQAIFFNSLALLLLQ
ncbi:hypothetical protein BDQ17DRAFT_1440407 [Cyathus striatus]|nr:hypothetical protein BDQ17DRAFT_1440407 [Cyathus striatus]